MMLTVCLFIAGSVLGYVSHVFWDLRKYDRKIKKDKPSGFIFKETGKNANFKIELHFPPDFNVPNMSPEQRAMMMWTKIVNEKSETHEDKLRNALEDENYLLAAQIRDEIKNSKENGNIHS